MADNLERANIFLHSELDNNLKPEALSGFEHVERIDKAAQDYSERPQEKHLIALQSLLLNRIKQQTSKLKQNSNEQASVIALSGVTLTELDVLMAVCHPYINSGFLVKVRQVSGGLLEVILLPKDADTREDDLKKLPEGFINYDISGLAQAEGGYFDEQKEKAKKYQEKSWVGKRLEQAKKLAKAGVNALGSVAISVPLYATPGLATMVALRSKLKDSGKYTGTGLWDSDFVWEEYVEERQNVDGNYTLKVHRNDFLRNAGSLERTQKGLSKAQKESQNKKKEADLAELNDAKNESVRQEKELILSTYWQRQSTLSQAGLSVDKTVLTIFNSLFPNSKLEGGLNEFRRIFSDQEVYTELKLILGDKLPNLSDLFDITELDNLLIRVKANQINLANFFVALIEGVRSAASEPIKTLFKNIRFESIFTNLHAVSTEDLAAVKNRISQAQSVNPNQESSDLVKLNKRLEQWKGLGKRSAALAGLGGAALSAAGMSQAANFIPGSALENAAPIARGLHSVEMGAQSMLRALDKHKQKLKNVLTRVNATDYEKEKARLELETLAETGFTTAFGFVSYLLTLGLISDNYRQVLEENPGFVDKFLKTTGAKWAGRLGFAVAYAAFIKLIARNDPDQKSFVEYAITGFTAQGMASSMDNVFAGLSGSANLSTYMAENGGTENIEDLLAQTEAINTRINAEIGLSEDDLTDVEEIFASDTESNPVIPAVGSVDRVQLSDGTVIEVPEFIFQARAELDSAIGSNTEVTEEVNVVKEVVTGTASQVVKDASERGGAKASGYQNTSATITRPEIADGLTDTLADAPSVFAEVHPETYTPPQGYNILPGGEASIKMTSPVFVSGRELYEVDFNDQGETYFVDSKGDKGIFTLGGEKYRILYNELGQPAGVVEYTSGFGTQMLLGEMATLPDSDGAVSNTQIGGKTIYYQFVTEENGTVKLYADTNVFNNISDLDTRESDITLEIYDPLRQGSAGVQTEEVFETLTPSSNQSAAEYGIFNKVTQEAGGRSLIPFLTGSDIPSGMIDEDSFDNASTFFDKDGGFIEAGGQTFRLAFDSDGQPIGYVPVLSTAIAGKSAVYGELVKFEDGDFTRYVPQGQITAPSNLVYKFNVEVPDGTSVRHVGVFVALVDDQNGEYRVGYVEDSRTGVDIVNQEAADLISAESGYNRSIFAEEVTVTLPSNEAGEGESSQVVMTWSQIARRLVPGTINLSAIGGPINHVVQPGDTLTGIIAQYNNEQSRTDANRLELTSANIQEFINANQANFQLGEPTAVAAFTAADFAGNTEAAAVFADRTPAEVARMLQAGAVINIGGQEYTVKPGDTVTSILERFGSEQTVRDFITANPDAFLPLPDVEIAEAVEGAPIPFSVDSEFTTVGGRPLYEINIPNQTDLFIDGGEGKGALEIDGQKYRLVFAEDGSIKGYLPWTGVVGDPAAYSNYVPVSLNDLDDGSDRTFAFDISTESGSTTVQVAKLGEEEFRVARVGNQLINEEAISIFDEVERARVAADATAQESVDTANAGGNENASTDTEAADDSSSGEQPVEAASEFPLATTTLDEQVIINNETSTVREFLTRIPAGSTWEVTREDITYSIEIESGNNLVSEIQAETGASYNEAVLLAKQALEKPVNQTNFQTTEPVGTTQEETSTETTPEEEVISEEAPVDTDSIINTSNVEQIKDLYNWSNEGISLQLEYNESGEPVSFKVGDDTYVSANLEENTLQVGDDTYYYLVSQNGQYIAYFTKDAGGNFTAQFAGYKAEDSWNLGEVGQDPNNNNPQEILTASETILQQIGTQSAPIPNIENISNVDTNAVLPSNVTVTSLGADKYVEVIIDGITYGFFTPSANKSIIFNDLSLINDMEVFSGPIDSETRTIKAVYDNSSNRFITVTNNDGQIESETLQPVEPNRQTTIGSIYAIKTYNSSATAYVLNDRNIIDIYQTANDEPRKIQLNPRYYVFLLPDGTLSYPVTELQEGALIVSINNIASLDEPIPSATNIGRVQLYSDDAVYTPLQQTFDGKNIFQVLGLDNIAMQERFGQLALWSVNNGEVEFTQLPTVKLNVENADASYIGLLEDQFIDASGNLISSNQISTSNQYILTVDGKYYLTAENFDDVNGVTNLTEVPAADLKNYGFELDARSTLVPLSFDPATEFTDGVLTRDSMSDEEWNSLFGLNSPGLLVADGFRLNFNGNTSLEELDIFDAGIQGQLGLNGLPRLYVDEEAGQALFAKEDVLTIANRVEGAAPEIQQITPLEVANEVGAESNPPITYLVNDTLWLFKPSEGNNLASIEKLSPNGEGIYEIDGIRYELSENELVKLEGDVAVSDQDNARATEAVDANATEVVPVTTQAATEEVEPTIEPTAPATETAPARNTQEAAPAVENTPEPTSTPTNVPATATSTSIPTEEPAASPTTEPTEAPTSTPTNVPATATNTNVPTEAAAAEPTASPTEKSTVDPTTEATTAELTSEPTTEPTPAVPTEEPTSSPTTELTNLFQGIVGNPELLNDENSGFRLIDDGNGSYIEFKPSNSELEYRIMYPETGDLNRISLYVNGTSLFNIYAISNIKPINGDFSNGYTIDFARQGISNLTSRDYLGIQSLFEGDNTTEIKGITSITETPDSLTFGTENGAIELGQLKLNGIDGISFFEDSTTINGEDISFTGSDGQNLIDIEGAITIEETATTVNGTFKYRVDGQDFTAKQISFYESDVTLLLDNGDTVTFSNEQIDSELEAFEQGNWLADNGGLVLVVVALVAVAGGIIGKVRSKKDKRARSNTGPLNPLAGRSVDHSKIEQMIRDEKL